MKDPKLRAQTRKGGSRSAVETVAASNYSKGSGSSASKSNTESFGKFFRSMLDSGVYLPPSQYEAAFLSAAHSEQDVQQTIAAAKEAFAAVK